VNRHLGVELVGHRQTLIDGGRGRAPIFVQLPPDGTRQDLLSERIGRGSFCASVSENSCRRTVWRRDGLLRPTRLSRRRPP
jgi:hypothetical protein